MGLLPAYIGIDQSYSAFAIILHVEDPAGPGHVEHLLDFSPERAGRGVARLAHIHRTLLALFEATDIGYDVRRVVMEGYAPASRYNREALGELGAVTKLALAEVFGFDGRVSIAPPTSLKKFVTGNGAAGKDLMLLAVYKKWGAEFSSNDLADAYGLMRIGYALENGTQLKYERDVLDAMRKTPNTGP
ncbi:hypothetical protein ACIGXM_14115 [Kitasatospora sp. NPDC052896]|uniref:hypothetical protein n=1 Tax=Kitasatospora sp. NPDC052896 TaxID=3364061 RepID=UPI0037C82C17